MKESIAARTAALKENRIDDFHALSERRTARDEMAEAVRQNTEAIAAHGDQMTPSSRRCGMWRPLWASPRPSPVRRRNARSSACRRNRRPGPGRLTSAVAALALPLCMQLDCLRKGIHPGVLLGSEHQH